MLARTDRAPLPFEAASEPDLELPPSPARGRARPLVSVIIPAFNAARFIAETLTSAQAQTWPDLEIIVVDDGSTDDTAAIVEAAAATDPRITLIRQANAGVAAARNAAIAAAKGDYVAPLDADDLWHPENISAQVAALERAGPGTAVAYAWHVRIDAAGRICGNGPRVLVEEGAAALARVVERDFIGNGSSTVIRRGCILEVGGYDPTLRARQGEDCEDVALTIALAERWNFAPVPRRLVGYRQHGASMSRKSEQMRRSHHLVIADLQTRHPRRFAASLRAGRAFRHASLLAIALLHGKFRFIKDAAKRARLAEAPAALVRLPGIMTLLIASALQRHVYVKLLAATRPQLLHTLPDDWTRIEALNDVWPHQSQNHVTPPHCRSARQRASTLKAEA